jgi:inner membrane protein
VIVASPPPVLFWRRDLIWREGRGIWRGRYDPFHALGGLESYTGPQPDGMGDPLARRTLARDPRLARFARWSILPMATVERQRCFVRIGYQDARFGGRLGAGRLGQQAVLPTGAPGC